MPQTYRATLQYDGTRYHGWQIQGDRPTVQAELRKAVQQVTSERSLVIGSGRTDAGVHAEGQIASFTLEKQLEPLRLRRALNGVLPADIRVTRLASAAPGFHAQFAARQKVYWYRLWNAEVMTPFWQRYALHVRVKLNLSAMEKAAKLFLGRHDFQAFAASSTTAETFERSILLSRFTRHGSLLVYQVAADGFLHHMVRNIVGTLLLVGRDRLPSGAITDILASRDRGRAGPRAPAHGLCLKRVVY